MAFSDFADDFGIMNILQMYLTVKEGKSLNS